MITFKNVSYKINNKTILNNITFNIKDGEKILIVGESGSGKSSLFNLLLSNISYTSGSIFYDKEELNKMSYQKLLEYRQKKVILILQQDDLDDSKTVYENLSMFYYKEEIDAILSKANMMDYKDKIVGILSGGERQRISIIKSVLANCDTLLCDEITSALDKANASKIISFIMKLYSNKTILFVTHTKEYYLPYIDHIIYLKQGKIEKEEILHDVANSNLRSKEKKYKSLNGVSIKQGFKKMSILNLLVFILSFLCFFINFSFLDIFDYLSYQSYSKYYDFNVFEIENNELEVDYINVVYSLEDIINNSNLYINDCLYENINLKPFYKDHDSYFVVNSKFANKFNNQINRISIKGSNMNIKEDKIEIINEDSTFSVPTIYYNYKKIISLLPDFTSTKYIYLSNKIEKEELFLNNPLYDESNSSKMYLDNNALKDYLTYLLVFNSIHDIIKMFFLVILLYCLIVTILIHYSIITKDKKKIAIYLSRGYSKSSILLMYLIPLLAYNVIPLMITIYYHLSSISILFTNFVFFISILIPFTSIVKKSLSELLKEEM